MNVKINIDFYDIDFEIKINRLDKDSAFLIYCACGSRSGQALSVMEDSEFFTVDNLEEGLYARKNAEYHVVAYNL
ncbi:rhodanese-like domain-containing protein [bacterium]|nr:rhodanese-like domain-containing protein [bacterium]